MSLDAGLMIEGGGMRSAYSVGVLDLFLKEGLEFKSVAAASSGAVIAGSYISKQKERNFDMLSHLSNNREAISIFRMLKDKELFNMNYIFDDIPTRLFPLDFQSMKKSAAELIIGTTNINTGEAVYHDRFDSLEELNLITRASCSLPVFAPSVAYKGQELMDGGVSNPLLIEPLLERGLFKNVVILTRNVGYRKAPTRLNWFYRRLFKAKPKLIKMLKDRHITYNNTMNLIDRLEAQGKIFVIQPELPLLASRIEKDQYKLKELYMQGYRDAERKFEALKRFIAGTERQADELEIAVEAGLENIN